jgi:hypothetical protein
MRGHSHALRSESSVSTICHEVGFVILALESFGKTLISSQL